MNCEDRTTIGQRIAVLLAALLFTVAIRPALAAPDSPAPASAPAPAPASTSSAPAPAPAPSPAPALAPAAPAAAAAALQTRLSAFDANYDALRSFVDQSGSNPADSYQDTRGRTFGQDVHDWVLGEDARSHIEALRREAGLAARDGNAGGAQDDLRQAQLLVDAEVQRILTIRLYWRMNLMLDAHRDLWQQLLDEVTPAQAAASHARIDPLEQQLVRMLGPDMTRPALESAMENLIGVYNRERGDLAHSISEQRIVAGAIDPQVPRQSPCPPAARGNSGAAKPSFVPGSVDLLTYYPPELQRDEIEGRVILKLRIDAHGCMRDSALQSSSGSPALDDAAVALVEHARFLPAEDKGRPAAASFDMAVRFELPPADKAAAIDRAVATPPAAQAHP